MVHAVGFPWLMRSVGLLNLLYCPLLIFTSHNVGMPVTTLVSISFKLHIQINNFTDPNVLVYGGQIF